jgi:hypothetical protein
MYVVFFSPVPIHLRIWQVDGIGGVTLQNAAPVSLCLSQRKYWFSSLGIHLDTDGSFNFIELTSVCTLVTRYRSSVVCVLSCASCFVAIMNHILGVDIQWNSKGITVLAVIFIMWSISCTIYPSSLSQWKTLRISCFIELTEFRKDWSHSTCVVFFSPVPARFKIIAGGCICDLAPPVSLVLLQ